MIIANLIFNQKISRDREKTLERGETNGGQQAAEQLPEKRGNCNGDSCKKEASVNNDERNCCHSSHKYEEYEKDKTRGTWFGLIILQTIYVFIRVDFLLCPCLETM